jgi:hypothetical protein
MLSPNASELLPIELFTKFFECKSLAKYQLPKLTMHLIA